MSNAHTQKTAPLDYLTYLRARNAALDSYLPATAHLQQLDAPYEPPTRLSPHGLLSTILTHDLDPGAGRAHPEARAVRDQRPAQLLEAALKVAAGHVLLQRLLRRRRVGAGHLRAPGSPAKLPSRLIRVPMTSVLGRQRWLPARTRQPGAALPAQSWEVGQLPHGKAPTNALPIDDRAIPAAPGGRRRPHHASCGGWRFRAARAAHGRKPSRTSSAPTRSAAGPPQQTQHASGATAARLRGDGEAVLAAAAARRGRRGRHLRQAAPRALPARRGRERGRHVVVRHARALCGPGTASAPSAPDMLAPLLRTVVTAAAPPPR